MEAHKANLFVVGAMKAGTTSFMDLLSGHTEIYTAPIKEPHYFIDELPQNLYDSSRFFSIDRYFEKDFPNALHTAKISKKEHYQKLFSLAKSEKYFVDGSPFYMHAPNAASGIYEYNPKARIIIICRDPLQRAFSHYNMDFSLARRKRSFKDLIKEEIILYHENKLPWNSYLGLSFYRIPLQRFRLLFSENVLVIHFGKLLSNPKEEFQRVSEFLRITPFSEKIISHKNETHLLRFQGVFYLLRRSHLKEYFSKIFKSTFKKWLFLLLSTKKKRSFVLSTEIHEELIAIFEKESKIER